MGYKKKGGTKKKGAQYLVLIKGKIALPLIVTVHIYC